MKIALPETKDCPLLLKFAQIFTIVFPLTALFGFLKNPRAYVVCDDFKTSWNNIPLGVPGLV